MCNNKTMTPNNLKAGNEIFSHLADCAICFRFSHQGFD